jgi:glycosyltransferase involved in cell wall biosynthesis
VTAATRFRLHLIGPLPPPQGGAAITCQVFLDEMRTNGASHGVSAVTWSDISPKRFRSSHDLSLQYFGEAFRTYIRMLGSLWGSDGILCLTSERWFATLLPVLLALRAIGTPVAVRFFGHSTAVWLRSLTPIGRVAFIAALRRMNGVFVESSALVRELQSLGLPMVRQSKNFRRVSPRRIVTQRAICPCRVVFMGLVSREKGALDLVEAIEAITDVAVVCDLWGDIEPAVAADFHARMTTSSRCRYRGAFVGDAARLLSDYDLFALPSYYAGEGHSGAVIEAMGAGLPAVVTDHQGLTDLVEDGVNGRLVPIKSVTELAGALRLLAKDQRLRSAMGEEGRRRAAEFEVGLNSDVLLDTLRGPLCAA